MSKKLNNNSLLTLIRNITITSVIWHIWCERNSRVFNRIQMPIHVRSSILKQDRKHLIQSIVDSKKISRDLLLILTVFEVKIDPNMVLQPPWAWSRLAWSCMTAFVNFSSSCLCSLWPPLLKLFWNLFSDLKFS